MTLFFVGFSGLGLDFVFAAGGLRRLMGRIARRCVTGLDQIVFMIDDNFLDRDGVRTTAPGVVGGETANKSHTRALPSELETAETV